MYDIIVIGAGPAGISAGIYAKSRGQKVLIIEKANVGGLIGKVSTVTHYSGIIENETGESFAKRLKEQAENSGIEIVYEDVKKVDLKSNIKVISTENNTYKAKKVIIANGTRARKLGIDGETQLDGKGIGLNAARDGKDFEGKNIYVVGGADGAVKEALYLAQFAKDVTIIHFEESLGCISEFKEKIKKTKNINLKLNSRLHAVYGIDKVESLDISDEKTGSIETISDPGCGIFVYAGTIPNTEMYTDLTLKDGFIPVDENMKTELDGVYAVGDIRVKPIRQVSTAVSDGTIAAINASL
ncbi:NAD(P)/FAD-dependent oxidoreductase [Peptacetobacter sp.]|uniref:NAD(P)/FAD-dependent oxidoreductase n=1 Tax=Peptacetobacter sp. TaxID=2991975 RepID=UPI002634553B|nr:NAD(P)/FAD-dependent oxidoreductase [Peptacetobacter sp.]